MDFNNFPTKKYDVIVCDPPWDVKKIVRKVRPNQKENLDYLTLSLKDIETLPIKNISNEKGAYIFLWTTQKWLFPAVKLLKKWGFKYLLTMSWDKGNGVCFFGFHYRTEFVIVGYVGKIDMYKTGNATPTIFQGRSEKHSAKPDEFYKLIERFGERRIDLFARKKREGWDVWGNEVETAVKPIPPTDKSVGILGVIL